MIVRTLAFAVLTLAATSLAAAEYAPGSEVTVEGTVTAFDSPRAFWIDVQGDAILVFGTSAQRALLAPGQVVRVEGSISDDFIKLANVELQARRVERVRAKTGAASAASPIP